MLQRSLWWPKRSSSSQICIRIDLSNLSKPRFHLFYCELPTYHPESETLLKYHTFATYLLEHHTLQTSHFITEILHLNFLTCLPNLFTGDSLCLKPSITSKAISRLLRHSTKLTSSWVWMTFRHGGRGEVSFFKKFIPRLFLTAAGDLFEASTAGNNIV